jgi:hypothetical protein
MLSPYNQLQMTTIKIIIYDDFGREIGLREKKISISENDFDSIEEGVEEFRQEILPEISKILLESQQKEFKKKPTEK